MGPWNSSPQGCLQTLFCAEPVHKPLLLSVFGLFVCLEMGVHCVDQAGFEQQILLPWLGSAGMTGVCHPFPALSPATLCHHTLIGLPFKRNLQSNHVAARRPT